MESGKPENQSAEASFQENSNQDKSTQPDGDPGAVGEPGKKESDRRSTSDLSRTSPESTEPNHGGTHGSGEGAASIGGKSPEPTTGVASGSRSDADELMDKSADNSISDLPQPTVGRLSLYYRELRRLLETGKASLNSQQLGRLVDVSPAVVRRDLSALGTIGRRGVGYDVTTLIDRIGLVLGSGVSWSVVLVGVGSLGDALLRYRGFQRLGFRLTAAFDNDPARIGTSIGGIQILDVAKLETWVADQRADLAILAVPAEHAPSVAGRLVAGGVSGILNFAPTTLRLGGEVAVVNVDLASELQRLAFTVHTKK